ncbi:MAG: radical SAM protein [Deltaproteobacteria bacterium]|nr:radical SAM protein [Deltaproteobacteria bacterium]
MHFVIRFETSEKNDVNYDISSKVRVVFPETELRKGDVVTFVGEEPLTRSEFYEISDDLTSKGVDIRFETWGTTFNNSDNIKHIFTKYKVKEVLIKIYSLNSPDNDRFFSYVGLAFKTLMGLANLLRTGYKDISILTYITDSNYISRIRTLYRFKVKNNLRFLYIELGRSIPIEQRIEVCRKLSYEFAGAEDVILRNNCFEIRLGAPRNQNVEIKTDRENGVMNMVLKNSCTNNCVYCTTRIVQSAYNSPLPYDSKTDVITAIKDNSKSLKKKSWFEIVAVEPLEHPDILDILSEIKECGFQSIRLLTHGRPLKDKALLKRLKATGVRELVIPISFHSEGSAGVCVGDKGAYSDIIKVFENIKEETSISFVFSIMIFRQNYREIDKIVDFLKKYKIMDCGFNLALPSIEDERFYLPYALRFNELMEGIEKIKDRRLAAKIISALSYIIPPCVVYRYYSPSLIRKIKSARVFNTKVSLASKREFSKFKATERCKDSKICIFGNFCAGVNRVYLKTFGDEEFKVVR